MAAMTPREAALLRELADVKSGVPYHKHTSTKGIEWRCASPYCDRGNDIRDVPQLGPGETDSDRYRRD